MHLRLARRAATFATNAWLARGADCAATATGKGTAGCVIATDSILACCGSARDTECLPCVEHEGIPERGKDSIDSIESTRNATVGIYTSNAYSNGEAEIL